jgi:hypothetical protein
MKRGAVIAVVLGAAALSGPSSAAAKVTQEDRDFARVVKAFDAESVAVAHDPALLAAIQARQQAATACLDTARSLGARRDGSGVLGDVFYTLHTIAPFFAATQPAADRYAIALRRLRLHNPVLRSARALELQGGLSNRAFARVSPDFCGPLRTWRDARFDLSAIPAPILAAEQAFDSGPVVSEERTTKLRRASVRLRAVGVRLAVRERFVGLRSLLHLDAILEGDRVHAALGSAVSGA